MEVLQDANYETMSLDDVIRDMKAKKALEEGHAKEDNSPFLRQETNYQFNRRPLKTAIQPRNYNRSNYLNHMAKKRVIKARKTLDLRHRIISIRASKQGLDLRWKIVSNMIVKLRQQAQQSRQRYPYPQLENPHGPRSSPFGGHCGGMVSQPKVSRSTLTQIERLVGRLPSWMKPTAAAVVQRTPLLPHSQHNLSPSGIYPLRTAFSPKKYSHEVPMHRTCTNNVNSCYYHTTPIVPNHYYQTANQGGDSEMHSRAYEMPPLEYDMPRPSNGMPRLAYEPSPRLGQPLQGFNRTCVIKSFPNSEVEDDIHIIREVSDEVLPTQHTMLSHRFSL